MCAGGDGRSDGTCRVHRHRGQLSADQSTHGNRCSDSDCGVGTEQGMLVGDVQDHDEQQRCEQRFDEQALCRAGAFEMVDADVADGSQQVPDGEPGRDRSAELGDPIGRHQPPFESPTQAEGQRDDRIEVRATDVTQRVDHRSHHHARRERLHVQHVVSRWSRPRS